jgi:tRNA G10  N-methylase Trm11
MKYFFVLGRNTELSLAELFEHLQHLGVSYIFTGRIGNIVIIETSQAIEDTFSLKRVGGITKYGKLLADNITQDDILGIALSRLEDIYEDTKLFFGFSNYFDTSIGKKAIARMSKAVNKAGITIKRVLKDKGILSRSVTSQYPDLSSVVVRKNKLIRRGAEFVVIHTDLDSCMIGQTIEVQYFALFSKVDYDRPAFDDVSGMLPPKLALSMVNLSGAKPGDIVLDPFCGSGTVLMMAMHTGVKKVLGSDLSHRAVDDSRKNLDWFKDSFKMPLAEYLVRLIDVQDSHETYDAESIDHIICEPYMGPPAGKRSKGVDGHRLVLELGTLYKNAFKSFSKILKKGGKVVFIIPQIQVGKQQHTIDILGDIKQMGFELTEQLNHVRYTKRGGLIYKREGQHVVREIFTFEYKG